MSIVHLVRVATVYSFDEQLQSSFVIQLYVYVLWCICSNELNIIVYRRLCVVTSPRPLLRWQ